ncbi:MAG TPA: hypothetical protein VFV68_17370 [Agriterribacter sp.]|nr:hypothetical protein [Agriterribacter sp.]
MKKLIPVIAMAIAAMACNNADNNNTRFEDSVQHDKNDTGSNDDNATKLYDSTNIPPKDSAVGQYPNKQ